MRATTIYLINRVRASMLMVPNFQPRRSGIVINNYFNCQGGTKDCNCNVINVSRDWDKCGYIGSDFKSNVDKKKYKDLVMECFGKVKNNSLRNRLKELSKNFKGEVFLNHRHKERFYNLLQDQDLDINYMSSRFVAILFIFTADERLWKASKNS